ncbi:MAG TPA: NAD(P)H-hydrate dehydratase, partial [Bacteroidia bacterium]|nr:NAD(P)H-hydrate dehydratase [Bacteroidia bacterium]
CPLVLDADAINCLSNHPGLLEKVPQNTILTPHIKEFDRLAGNPLNDAERHKRQVAFSVKYKVLVVLKGAHTCISAPDGSVYFNSTGNPGMAKGGSGDALTGVILALLAQGYSSLDASRLAVFVHGTAGDIAKEKFTEYSMTSMDLVAGLGDAFKMILHHEL